MTNTEHCEPRCEDCSCPLECFAIFDKTGKFLGAWHSKDAAESFNERQLFGRGLVKRIVEA